MQSTRPQSKALAAWSQSTARVSAEMVSQVLPGLSDRQVDERATQSGRLLGRAMGYLKPHLASGAGRTLHDVQTLPGRILAVPGRCAGSLARLICCAPSLLGDAPDNLLASIQILLGFWLRLCHGRSSLLDISACGAMERTGAVPRCAARAPKG